MTFLVMALYAEGSVDRQFLPMLIQRTSERILQLYGNTLIDISETIVLYKQYDMHLDKCILQASQEARGYHALLVHSDSDNLGYELARKQRFEPGFTLVQQTQEEHCGNLVPIIPVRMIEAWMLADTATLCQVLGTNLSPSMLNIAHKASQVESITKPKELLHEVVNRVNAGHGRRRTIQMNTRYELLARRVDLNKLFDVPSYRFFVVELAQTLEELHFIAYGSTTKLTSSTSFHI